MNERERAERFAQDLDQYLQNRTSTDGQASLEDQKLLELAGTLQSRTPFAPTPAEQAQLRQRLERWKVSGRLSTGQTLVPNVLKPIMQSMFWIALLLGVFTVSVILISNLIDRPSEPGTGPAPITTPESIPAEVEPTAASAPRPVSMSLEEALVLVQSPRWKTVFFEYQVVWKGMDGKRYSFYKQAWMDREKRGHVISSDQVESNAPRSAETKPILYFSSDGSQLNSIHLPSGFTNEGFANSPWSVSPLENAGQAMADFFPTLSGIDQAGPLTLEPFEAHVAGRPAFVLRGHQSAYWYDMETGLLLRKERFGEQQEEIFAIAVAYNIPLPADLDKEAGLEQIRFVNVFPSSMPIDGSTEVVFPLQSQNVNGLHLELREVATIGSSLRATLCYQPSDSRAWRIEAVQLQAGGRDLPFYPSSSGRPIPGADGFACETFTAAHPGMPHSGNWTIQVLRMVAPFESTPDCEQISQQIAKDYPGFTIRCHGSGWTVSSTPEEMSDAEVRQLHQTYMEYEVHTGPWIFPFRAAHIIPRISPSGPANPVVVPSTCDEHSNLLADPSFAAVSAIQPAPAWIAGGGILQSGDFTFLMGLTCNTNFSRLKSYSSEHSEINGLGVLFTFRYDGEQTSGDLEYFSGVWPFVMHGGGSGSFSKGEFYIDYEGLLFPENIRPDFTQSDIRLRYPVRVRLPDGRIEGAALEFTLLRAPEGYRPVDVQVEPLTAEERQKAELDANPSAPLPFPTLPPPDHQGTAETQVQRDLLDLLDRWQQPLLASPGWVYARKRVNMPNGNDLFVGLKEYMIEDWYQIDAQGMVVTNIHIETRLDGTALQQSYTQNGRSTNLTFGNEGSSGETKPYPLDLAYSIKAALKSGNSVQIAETTLDGSPIMLVTVPGVITWREAVDARNGAWLYSEMVKTQASDAPSTGGKLDWRHTNETIERVDSPPAYALALLGKEFSGYVPPAPYGTPVPHGFDPSLSSLRHHSVPADSFHGPSFWYGDIYADDYLLGRVDFGSIPGGTSCDRSADGAKLAYVRTTVDQESGNVTEMQLTWFDLRDFSSLHHPYPELTNIGQLGWSPALNWLAVFGCKTDQKDCGLYLLNPENDQIERIVPDVYTSWPLIWNKDGRQLAFINHLPEANNILYVVELLTGNIVYQGAFNADSWQVPADSPTNAWGETFPRSFNRSACFEEK